MTAGDQARMTAGSGRIVAELETRSPAAAFATELRAAVGEPDIERDLSALEAAGQVLTVAMPAPDPHLVGVDLRVVGLVPGSAREHAEAAIRSVWDEWLRGFLATHRCG